MYKSIIFPFYHNIKNDKLLKRVQELRINQYEKKEKIQIIQQEKLKNLLLHSYKYVPYYKSLIDKYGLSINSLHEYKNFKKLPYLNKDIIRKNFKELISTNLNGNKLYNCKTSGSTGESLYFYIDRNTVSYRKASVIVNQEWTNIYPGDKKASLWGAPMDQKKAYSLRGRIHGLVAGVLFLSSYDLSPNIMDKYIKKIKSFQPKLLISYPGPLEVFAEHTKKRKVDFYTLKSIITSAEQLNKEQRKLFENVFNAKVYDRYGSREMGTIAHECNEQNGFHVDISRVFVEILDDNGNCLPPGSMGELYVTDLNNYGFPMIRYKINDRAAWSNSICECGRGLPLLSIVEGRSLDIVKTKDNKKLGGTFWTILFKTKPGIKQFQAFQENLDGIIIYYVKDENFEKTSLIYFEKKIKDKCGKNFDVKFVHKKKIDKTASGKHRIVISNC